MKRLFRFEFHKLLRQKSLYICLGVMLFMVFLQAVMLSLIEGILTSVSAAGVTAFLGGVTGKSFMLTALSSSSFPTVSAVFVSLLFCGDFLGGAEKNILGHGFSRLSVLLTKGVTALCGLTFMTLVTLLFSALIGGAFFGFSFDLSGTDIAVLLAQLLSVLTYGGMTFLFCALSCRIAISLVFGILAPTVISLVATVGDYILRRIFTSLTDSSLLLSDFWFGGCATTVMGGGIDGAGTVWRCIAVLLVWLLAFAALSVVSFRRKEV